MTRTLAAAAALASALLAFAPAAAGAAVPPGRGTITGYVSVAGGPAPGRAHPVSGRVELTSRNGLVHATVGRDGHFTVAVPPGAYSLRLLGAGSASCTVPSLRVVNRKTTAVRIACSIK